MRQPFRAAVVQRAAPEGVVPLAPPVPVVPEGPTLLEPVLPEVPPDGAADMPAPLPEFESVVPPAVPPDMPAAGAAPVVLPAVPALALSGVVPAPVVGAPDMAPVVPGDWPAAVPLPLISAPVEELPVEEVPDIAPVVPGDGAAAVLDVLPLLMVVDAPGDVVSAARRSQPATTAVSAAVASMSLVSLDKDCMEISLCIRIGCLLRTPVLAG